MLGVPYVRLISIFYCFVDFVESINYTARTEARLFVSLRGQSGGPLTCFLSASKKPNYYRRTQKKWDTNWNHVIIFPTVKHDFFRIVTVRVG